MKTVVVVNGETDWQDYLPEFRVVRRRLQETRWVLRGGELWVVDSSGGERVDGVLWRLGAVKPRAEHRSVLEILRLSAVPCVNLPDVLLQGYDRLSMLSTLRRLDIPMNAFDVVQGERMLLRLQPSFPVVVKIGNYHGGFGKTLVHSEAQWQDVVDIAFVSDEYVTVEPFMDYARDVRCLFVKGTFWGMARQSASWKVNQGQADFALMEPPTELIQQTQAVALSLGADILALDFVETRDGEYICLEYNDVPGLSGFPVSARAAVADCLRRVLEN